MVEELDPADRVEASQGYRDWVLSLIRSGATPAQPLMVGKNVMADCRKDADLCQLVDQGLIRETPMLPTTGCNALSPSTDRLPHARPSWRSRRRGGR